MAEVLHSSKRTKPLYSSGLTEPKHKQGRVFVKGLYRNRSSAPWIRGALVACIGNFSGGKQEAMLSSVTVLEEERIDLVNYPVAEVCDRPDSDRPSHAFGSVRLLGHGVPDPGDHCDSYDPERDGQRLDGP